MNLETLIEQMQAKIIDIFLAHESSFTLNK